MNGERLVAEAAKLIAKGESYYQQAAEKIEQAAERGIPNTEIAVGLGRSEAWVRALRNWNAQGSQSTTSLPFSEEQGAVAKRHARAVLRGTPEQVAEILEDPEIRRNVARAQDLRHTEQKQRSEKAYREAIGEDTADALDSQQVLLNAEAELFKSRRALRDVLAILRTIDLTEVRESWLEEFVKTFDDIEAMLQLGRSLVDGHSVDDAIDRILEGSK